MRRAIELARESVARGGGPFGAVVARGEDVVGTGSNRVVESADPTAHAEVEAIRAACRALRTHDLSGCTLFTSCEPCPMCLGAILWARVDRLVYACDRHDAARAGFDDAAFYAEAARAPAERELPSEQLLRDEGLGAFEAWLATPDRRPY